jgi:hypothetical protein
MLFFQGFQQKEEFPLLSSDNQVGFKILLIMSHISNITPGTMWWGGSDIKGSTAALNKRKVYGEG